MSLPNVSPLGAQSASGPQFLSHRTAFPMRMTGDFTVPKPKIGFLHSRLAVVGGDAILVLVTSVAGRAWGQQPSAVTVGLFLSVTLLVLYLAGLYDHDHLYHRTQIVITTALSMSFIAAVVASVDLYFQHVALSRTGLLVYTTFVGSGAVGLRWARIRFFPVPRTRVAFLGGDEPNTALIDRLCRSPRVVNIGDFCSNAKPADERSTHALRTEVFAGAVDAVVVTPDVPLTDYIAELLLVLRCRGVSVLNVSEASETYNELLDLDALSPAWVALSSQLVGARGELPIDRVKRAMDIVVALFVGIVALPLIAISAILVRLESRGPVFYRQTRVGMYGKSFAIVKIRSMRTDAEALGAQWATVRDPRITRIGRFLRKTRLDELPQILNVLRGEMSLVGPRPERPEFVDHLETVIPYYSLRHMVHPGLTGWAQVRYPYGASIEDARKKLEYDLYYIRHRSVVMDVQILTKTIRVMFQGSGAR